MKSAVQSSSFERTWQERFERFAEKNDDDAAIAGWTRNGLETRYRSFTRLWKGPGVEGQWLDAGCGAGTYTRALAAHGIKVFGMDYSLPTIVKAKRKGNLGGQWLAGDVTRLPIKPGVFDGALCFGVMQALSAPDPAMRELAGVIKPGGQIWVDALNYWCLPHLWEVAVRKIRGRSLHVRFDSPRQLKKLMKSAGLVKLTTFWILIVPQRFERWQWLVELSLVRYLVRRIPPLGAILSHAFVIKGELPELAIAPEHRHANH